MPCSNSTECKLLHVVNELLDEQARLQESCRNNLPGWLFLTNHRGPFAGSHLIPQSKPSPGHTLVLEMSPNCLKTHKIHEKCRARNVDRN